MTDEPELLADRYELGEVIGHGAMGTVRAGHDRVLDRIVAVKLLHAHLADEPDTRARFEQEARLAARLHHPNAVTVFDSGEHEGTPFIVMEHVAGETLAARIARGPLDAAAARRLGAQVLDALGAAHALGIVHRDVKPGNILLTADGHAKLADFGIAKSADGASHTSVGQVVGTLAYLAPERIQGATATPQSDLYAVGVVLYEALTGVKPFAATTPVARLDEARATPAPDPRTVVPDIDGSLALAIHRALHPDPARRFATAATMGAALVPSAAGTARLPIGAAPVAPTRAVAYRIVGGVAAALVLTLLVTMRSDPADGPSPFARFSAPGVNSTEVVVTVPVPPTTEAVAAARELTTAPTTTTPSTTTTSTTTTSTTSTVAPKAKGKPKKNGDED
jgi:serine/threonine-protein kinase